MTTSSVAVDVGLSCLFHYSFITCPLALDYPLSSPYPFHYLLLHRSLTLHSEAAFKSKFIPLPFQTNKHIKAVNLDRQPLPQINLSELSLHHLFISKSKLPSYSFNLSTSHIFGILSFLLTNGDLDDHKRVKHTIEITSISAKTSLSGCHCASSCHKPQSIRCSISVKFIISRFISILICFVFISS